MERSAAVALFLFAFLALASNALAKRCISPPRGTVKISELTYAGDGCPPGSAEGVMSSDAEALTVMFSNYSATTDSTSQDRRKVCTLTVKLIYPAGFIFHLGTCTMRGYGMLEEGVTGTVQTSYHISGLGGTSRTTRVMKGPFDDNFEFTDRFVGAAYSQCRKVRNLNIKSEVRVNPGTSGNQGLMTIDSTDLKLTEVFHLSWSKKDVRKGSAGVLRCANVELRTARHVYGCDEVDESKEVDIAVDWSETRGALGDDEPEKSRAEGVALADGKADSGLLSTVAAAETFRVVGMALDFKESSLYVLQRLQYDRLTRTRDPGRNIRDCSADSEVLCRMLTGGGTSVIIGGRRRREGGGEL
ncbi:hypothetical protein CBR_g58376 [Chara braunii]|uniref:DUF4360 domain-containing protein n=1 Tax=Chara braunii TaxID=69332 RepID=A0A388MEY3_CHABU|nr:hypothetical protein CBR_g58376 [Chara braunii]|eukprot:GBG93042.1 hypothetical protein CBR_g58376 [Chara braunii]